MPRNDMPPPIGCRLKIQDWKKREPNVRAGDAGAENGRPYTVKIFRKSTDILWRVFHILTEPVPYRFVSVNRQNNEAWAHIAGPT